MLLLEEYGEQYQVRPFFRVLTHFDLCVRELERISETDEHDDTIHRFPLYLLKQLHMLLAKILNLLDSPSSSMANFEVFKKMEQKYSVLSFPFLQTNFETNTCLHIQLIDQLIGCFTL